jgi:DmsE family decaheme c-type cytochrome
MRHLLFCIGLVCLLLSSRSDAQSRPASEGAHQSPAIPGTGTSAKAPAGYTGAEVCASCHTDEANSFSTNPHSKLVYEHAGNGMTCESCHGPGQAHVDSGGDVTKIVGFTKASAKKINETCLTCHAGAHPNFEQSPHAEAGLSCTSCHSVHHSDPDAHLLTTAQPQLCYRCHADVRAKFSLPFHHRVPERLMNCSDCHNPHGTFENRRTQLRNTAEGNAVCTKCHTETAGPFVYEHPVVKTEGCVSCHTPHGSSNPRLLKVTEMNTLCLQCHSTTNMTAFPRAIAPSGPVHNQAAQYVACTTCHTQIHGSNVSDVFFK